MESAVVSATLVDEFASTPLPTVLSAKGLFVVCHTIIIYLTIAHKCLKPHSPSLQEVRSYHKHTKAAPCRNCNPVGMTIYNSTPEQKCKQVCKSESGHICEQLVSVLVCQDKHNSDRNSLTFHITAHLHLFAFCHQTSYYPTEASIYHLLLGRH